jgi:hypothetical protein
MIYIFNNNQFKFTELINNYIQQDYNYDILKNLLQTHNNLVIIDNVPDANHCINQGLNTDDIILCVDADKVYEKLKAQLYFCTKSFDDFIEYITYIKIDLKYEI